MKERINTVLYYLVIVYASLCAVVRISVHNCNELPAVFYTLTFAEPYGILCGSTNGYDLILLTVLIIARYIVFGKTFKS